MLMTKTISRHRGASILYTIVIMSAMMMFCSLAVDVARVQLAKTEIRRAVDSAARYGALGLDTDATTAINNAAVAASDNLVDGSPMKLVTAQDVSVGTWNTASRKFTPLTGFPMANANAIQVLGSRMRARNNAIPLSFASVMGMTTCD